VTRNCHLIVQQTQSIVDREWLKMLELGGNIYYTFKLAIFDGMTMQAVGGEMSGITTEEFAKMMVNGGRPIEGNRYKSEWKDR
jgi:protocatechuate 4,5-dioxygenase alpha chain